LHPSLKQYANEHQLRILNAVEKHGSESAAAKYLEMDRRNVSRLVRRVEAKAAKQGYSPDHNMTNTVPDGYFIKGVSTLYGDGGEVKAQWVKSLIDPEQQEAMYRDAISAMGESIPREKAVKPPKKVNDDLLSLYVLTDYHLGMLAWGEEAGADWDIKIAEDLLVNWFLAAIRRSDNAKVGVLAQLGDLLHYDGMEAVTPASGNILDADSRFQKVVRVAIRAFRRIIREMLKKHEQVHIIHAEGNHDPASSIWLRELFHTLYEDEPRVTVELSPDPYYCYEFGDTSLFFHHGHKRKAGNIDDVFVAKFREVYGRTKHAYGHIGHLHHKHTIEGNLMIVEQHRTLASPDAYASRGGWMSGRSADLIVYHKGFGEIGRFTIPPEMV
jgi:hypothetical protein